MKTILLLALSLVACAPPTSNHYTVKIDPAFDSLDIQAIYAAYDAWTAITDGKLRIEYSTAPCAGDQDEICWHASDMATILAKGGEAGYIGFTEWNDNHADVYIPTAKDAGYNLTQLTQITSHEAGHTMQLVHLQQGVMCSNPGCASLTVSCHDAAEWYTVHEDNGWTEWWPGNKSCPKGASYHPTQPLNVP